jgi:hypothetical protein
VLNTVVLLLLLLLRIAYFSQYLLLLSTQYSISHPAVAFRTPLHPLTLTRPTSRPDPPHATITDLASQHARHATHPTANRPPLSRPSHNLSAAQHHTTLAPHPSRCITTRLAAWTAPSPPPRCHDRELGQGCSRWLPAQWPRLGLIQVQVPSRLRQEH